MILLLIALTTLPLMFHYKQAWWSMLSTLPSIYGEVSGRYGKPS